MLGRPFAKPCEPHSPQGFSLLERDFVHVEIV